MTDQLDLEGLSTLQERLTTMRDKYLMPTPDKTDTAWAIVTETINALPALISQAREAERMRGALERQCENMAFALNRVDLNGWTDKFTAELAEDRQALAPATGGGE